MNKDLKSYKTLKILKENTEESFDLILVMTS